MKAEQTTFHQVGDDGPGASGEGTWHRLTATVHTDGGCDPNPGPGGWAAVIQFTDREVVLSGNAPQTTNNRMELEAAIAAMAYLSARHGAVEIDLYTDSRYLRQGITKWIDDWFARGWKTKAGRSVQNQDLWRKLYDLIHASEVRWHWIKGHKGDPLNERVDRLATAARERLPVLRDDPSFPSPSSHLSPENTASAKSGGPYVELSVAASCQGSSGPGGWGAVLRSDDSRRALQGHEQETTINALYLHAATQALEALTRPCQVTAYTTSHYLARGAGEWVDQWRSSGWRTKGGESVKNREDWEALLEATRGHQVTWQAVTQKGGETLPRDLAEAKDLAASATTKE
jgi:ribonuclease HI